MINNRYDKYIFWVIQILVAIVGFFLINTMNNITAIVNSNKKEILETKLMFEKRMSATESKVHVIEQTNELTMKRIELKIDDLKSFTEKKFDRYDNSINQFYKDYKLEKK